MTQSTATVDALILAGGQGTRLGGLDKGLIRHRQQAFAARLAHLLKASCRQVLVSCNRNLTDYAQIGDRQVTDQLPDYPGPLAGIYSAALATDADYLLICPCDTPSLDASYPERMLANLQIGMRPRVAHDGNRMQQLHLLVGRGQALACGDYLTAGGRSVYDWLMPLIPGRVDFSDRAEMFHNINTQEDLEHWRAGQ